MNFADRPGNSPFAVAAVAALIVGGILVLILVRDQALRMLLGGALFVVITVLSARRVLLSMRAGDQEVGVAMQLAHLYDVGARAEVSFRVDDPTFSKGRLEAHARAVAKVLGAGDLEAMHPWVSDGLFQRLRTQRRLGVRTPELEAFARFAPNLVRIAEASVGAQYQHARVYVGLGADVKEQGVALTFLRRRVAKTPAAGLPEARCPHCGGPLALSASQRCSHCEAIVNSGTYDWVLCAVAPATEHLSRQADLLDPDHLRALDPALAPEEVVDRASLTFWRWLEARRTGETARLARVATDEFLGRLEATPAPRGTVSSGGGELRLLRALDGGDEAHVVIRWVDVPPGGGLETFQTVFKLRRPKGLRTAEQAGLSTLRCGSCLAAVTDAESPACEYCGTSLRDAWCVFDVEDYLTWRSDAVAVRRGVEGDWARISTPVQRETALALMISVLRADGVVSDAERARLAEITARWGLPPGQLDAAIAAPPSLAGRPEFARDLAVSLTRELARLAFADGRLQPLERRRLEAIATMLSTNAELETAIVKAARERAQAAAPPRG